MLFDPLDMLGDPDSVNWSRPESPEETIEACIEAADDEPTIKLSRLYFQIIGAAYLALILRDADNG